MTCFSLRWFSFVMLLHIPTYCNGKNSNGLQPNTTSDMCASQHSCVGCHQIKVCSPGAGGVYHELSLVNCTPPTPYCKEDTGTCTAEMRVECAPRSEDFTCMRQTDTFPHPTNCTLYHVCRDYTAYTLSCLTNSVYNSRTGECDSTACYAFDCRSGTKNGVKVRDGNNKAIYAYCIEGLVSYVDRCPANYELDEASQECAPACKDEGIIPDRTNSYRYYVCKKSSSGFAAQPRLCPNGTVFDQEYVQCRQP